MIVCNTETFAIQMNRTQFVYFSAPWCVSCPPVQNALEKAEPQHPHVTFTKVDVETDAAIAESFRVGTLPTVIVFHEGKERTRFTGSTAGKNAIAYIAGSA